MAFSSLGSKPLLYTHGTRQDSMESFQLASLIVNPLLYDRAGERVTVVPELSDYHVWDRVSALCIEARGKEEPLI